MQNWDEMCKNLRNMRRKSTLKSFQTIFSVFVLSLKLNQGFNVLPRVHISNQEGQQITLVLEGFGKLNDFLFTEKLTNCYFFFLLIYLCDFYNVQCSPTRCILGLHKDIFRFKSIHVNREMQLFEPINS